MYRTIPVKREIEMGEREVKITFRTYKGYHLEEFVIRPSAIEVRLVKGEDVVLNEFPVPTTVNSTSLSANWRHVRDGEVVELTLTRALKTMPGLHPRRAVRKQNLLRGGALSKVKLVAG
jgi:hypothetical protein